jgi:uncharacterized protein (DUF1697 family)
MKHVVLLRGVNVGGHRTFRPVKLAEDLQHLGAINIGAAGTFVTTKPITPSQLRAELARRLPFETEIMICPGRDFARLLAKDWFTGRPSRPDIVRFVSVLSRAPRLPPPLPLTRPERGQWVVRVLACEGRFVIGEYRRQMKAIGYLGTLDRLFATPATMRNWNTIVAIGKALDRERSDQ